MKGHKTYSNGRGQKLTKLALKTFINKNVKEASPEVTAQPSTSKEMELDENDFIINKDTSLLDISLADMSIGPTSFTLDSDFVLLPLQESFQMASTETRCQSLGQNEENALSLTQDQIGGLQDINVFTDNKDHDATNDINTSVSMDITLTVQSTEPITENRRSVTESTENIRKENEPDHTAAIDDIQYTKKGSIRKRKKYELDLKQRKKIKKDSFAEKHNVKPPCNSETCKKKCVTKITDDRRVVLNKAYWGMETETERKTFILNNVTCVQIKQRKVIAEDNEFQRKKNYQYILKDDKDVSQIVCKTFFMSTLGYNTSSDKFMRNVKERPDNIVPPIDKRRIREPHNKIDDQLIRQHILQFEPCTSHYRREHAPNRLYLPSDLTFTSLYKDFMEKNPDVKCSYEKYRTYARDVMKISIVKLGHEECEKCEEYRLHDKNHTASNLETACEYCRVWKIHNDKVTLSRLAYKKDAEKEWDKNVAVYSVDLQKVIMLPRLDMFKSAIFVQRLTAYNESFVPVGKNKITSRNQIMAVLWHEAISGRNKEDLISTFYKFVTCHREDKKNILWLDNCTSQNKNWALFSFFIYIINSNEINAEEIILKYFEPGHSFMSADSFHHRVEVSMKRAGCKIYDFQDFCQAVSQSSKHVDVKCLTYEDFCTWEDFSSQHKLKKINPRPYLNDMVEVTFRKGCLDILYKKSYEGEVFAANFLLAKFTRDGQLPRPKQNNKPKGISAEKKHNLIKVLEPIMIKNRLKFWICLYPNN